MKKILASFICLVMAVCVPLLTSCSQRVDAETRPAVSEGDESVCEVTGYTTYAGPFDSLFLKEGDMIAVISPGALPSQVQVDSVVEGLKSWGYVPVTGKYVCTENRTLENCQEDLKWAMEDPSVRAIFCVRGGYGSSEVMGALTEQLMKKTDKLIIGYSDVTIFHSAWTKAGCPSIHASMSEAFMGLAEDCVKVEEKMLKGEIPAYKCSSNKYCKKGTAEGILIGGNLATFLTTIHTGYDCTNMQEPYILFFEDVNENMAHIHRYLTILKNEGILDRAAGIVFGEWVNRPASDTSFDGSSRGGRFASVAEMIDREFLVDLDVPVAFDFPSGHGAENYPLLMGEKVKLKVTKDHYTLKWE